MTHAVPDYDAKLYSASQTMDEARHVEVYGRYIRKLGQAYPISPWLKAVIDEYRAVGVDELIVPDFAILGDAKVDTLARFQDEVVA